MRYIIPLFLLISLTANAQMDTIRLIAKKIETQNRFLKSNNAPSDSTLNSLKKNSDFTVERVPLSLEIKNLDRANFDSVLHKLGNWKVELPAGGSRGEFVQTIIDSSFIHNSIDSQAIVNYVKRYYAKNQKDYFNLIYKPLPEIEGTTIDNNLLNTNSFLGKPLVIFIYDGAKQSTYLHLNGFLKLQKELSEKGVQFLILSYESRSEMEHFAKSRNLSIPIIPDVRQLCFQNISSNFPTPYIITLTEKGIINNIEIYPDGDHWFQFGDVCANCYIDNHAFNKAIKDEDYFYKKLISKFRK